MAEAVSQILARAEAAHEKGDFVSAEKLYLELLTHHPDHARARLLLGALALETGRAEAAAALMQEALQLDPTLPHGEYNLGLALLEAGRPVAAQEAFVRAMEQGDSAPETCMDLGNALLQQGRPLEAARLYRKARKLAPENPVIVSAALMGQQYLPGQHEKELLRLHQELLAPWNQAQDAPPSFEYANEPETLRIGLLSPDLRSHPVGYFMLPWVEAHDPQRLEIFCYADGEKAANDAVTRRLRKGADAWCEIAGMDDSDLAQRIRKDGVHILLDLAGQTKDNRFALFAGRAAPVQVSWAGYVGTTGLETMDYLLTDRVQTPPESSPFYCEALAMLPECYVSYAPPEHLPPVGELAAAKTGHVTFGCLNGMPKLNRGVLALWAEVLHAVPGSRLLLANRHLGEAALRDNIFKVFREQVIEAQRLELLGGRPNKAFLELYHQVDVSLDPFPYSGGLTTLESLAMGVPVLGMTGSTFAGRHAASHLTAVGLADWCVDTPEKYLKRAQEVSRDLEGLSVVHSTLRERLLASPLCNGERFARHLEHAFKTMWRQHAGGGKKDFSVAPLPM